MNQKQVGSWILSLPWDLYTKTHVTPRPIARNSADDDRTARARQVSQNRAVDVGCEFSINAACRMFRRPEHPPTKCTQPPQVLRTHREFPTGKSVSPSQTPAGVFTTYAAETHHSRALMRRSVRVSQHDVTAILASTQTPAQVGIADAQARSSANTRDGDMQTSDFVDYYELMEISPNANEETIERIFRYLGQRLHPDNAETGNDHQFRQLMTAYQTLRDPGRRAAYDVFHRQAQASRSELLYAAQASGDDSQQRHYLLTIFYGQRRRNMRTPGLGIATLEQMLNCPREVLEFHLWYFQEKRWVKREESGLFAITAEGIDCMESSEYRMVSTGRAITMQPAAEHSAEPSPKRHHLRRSSLAFPDHLSAEEYTTR